MRNLRRAVLALSLLLAGCGGGGASQGIVVTIMPSSTALPVNGIQQFTAKVTGASNGAVTWQVNGITGGNGTVGAITPGGLYNAPPVVPTPATVSVGAVAQADSSKSATAQVTILPHKDNQDAQAFPVKLGTSGGNVTDLVTGARSTTCCSGTLGSLVTRGGTLFILSNNHVLDKSDQGTVGDGIAQPGLADANCDISKVKIVANLSQAATLQPSSNVDAAIAAIVSGAVDTSGSILDLDAPGQPGIPASNPAVPAAVLAANEGVAKSGGATSLTCSTLQSVSTQVKVDYSTQCGGGTSFSVTFNNQIVVNGTTFSANGDSGSLVVTSDTAQPVGLLFAGSNNNTVANPIQDVLNALKDPNTGAVPSFVGGGHHGIACPATAQAMTVEAALTQEQIQRASLARERGSVALASNPAVTRLELGRSADDPEQPALVVYVNQSTAAIPAQVDGVRVRVVYAGGAEGSQPARLRSEDLEQAARVKSEQANRLFAGDGVLGVGVGRSADDPASAAVVLYLESGKPHADVPASLDGVRTRVIVTERFRAYQWGQAAGRRSCSSR